MRSLRMTFGPRPSPAGLHGGWWPQSRDPVRELGSLLPVLNRFEPSALQQVRLNVRDWDDHPATLGVVRLEWLRLALAQTLHVDFRNGRSLRLLVVPPDMDPQRATWALHVASDPDNEVPPAELLTVVARRPAPALPGQARPSDRVVENDASTSTVPER